MLLLVLGCENEQSEEAQDKKTQSFFVGTYTLGESQGIYRYSLHTDGSLELIGLATKTQNPSFLAKTSDNKYLIAVNEINENGLGYVESYAIDNDSLLLLSTSSSGGAHPCFVTTNSESFVLVANYTGGNVGLLKLNSNGKLSPLLNVQEHHGKGITERQEAPHAHSAWFEPNSNDVISVDLGTNELWFSRVDNSTQTLVASDLPNLKMAQGAGPRHLTFHKNGVWIYVINELTSTVTKVEKSEDGTYNIGSTVSTLPIGFREHNQCADIHISADGKHLYASNRGHNSIASYNIDDKSGNLTLIGHVSTEGDWPRNFSLSPDEKFLLVANEKSNNIVSFRRYKKTGTLKYVSKIDAPSPVCILF